MYFTKTCVYVKNHIKHESEGKGNDSGDVQMVKTERVVAYGENMPRTSECDYLSFVLQAEKTSKLSLLEAFKITSRMRKIIAIMAFTVQKLTYIFSFNSRNSSVK